MSKFAFILCFCLQSVAFAATTPPSRPIVPDDVGLNLIYPGSSIQALLSSVPTSGGTAYIKAGTYPQTTTLIINSNTRMVCEPGVLITADSATWTGSVLALINNQNWSASSITDHDILIQGCTFQALNTLGISGGYHHIGIRMAQRIRVENNTFLGGGDGTAFQGNNDTVVFNNYMTGATNACWDHWEASTSLVVRDNYCTTNLDGILATGTNTTGTLAGTTQGGVIAGNTVIFYGGGNAGAGIWMNGLGASGSGASDITVSNNYVSGDGTTNFICFKISGASSDNSVIGNSCRQTGTNSAGFSSSSDIGGTPSNGLIANNIFDNVQVQTGNIAVLQLLGTSDSAFGNRVYGGNYPSAFWLGGTNDVAAGNVSQVGAGVLYNLTGATNPVVSSASGGLSLLSTQVASGSAALSFTGIGPGPNTLLLDCNGVFVGTNNNSMLLQYGEGTTPTWETASYAYSASAYSSTGGASNPFSANASGIALYTLGLSSIHGFNAKVWISLTQSDLKVASYTVAYADATDAPDMVWISGSGSYHGDTNPITALRIISGAGTISSGQCSLYSLSPS